MRIIVSFNGGGLTINFENISEIYNYPNYIKLFGKDMVITVNAVDICIVSALTIQKSWLLTATEVYFDTRIEEDK